MHGKQSICTAKADEKIFKGLTDYMVKEDKRELKFKAARYHSLSVKKETLPEELEIIAVSDDDGEVMSVKHKKYKMYGLQFHPESILTPEGIVLIKNFINI
jgi:anthranilate synthase component 2